MRRLVLLLFTLLFTFAGCKKQQPESAPTTTPETKTNPPSVNYSEVKMTYQKYDQDGKLNLSPYDWGYKKLDEKGNIIEQLTIPVDYRLIEAGAKFQVDKIEYKYNGPVVTEKYAGDEKIEYQYNADNKLISELVSNRYSNQILRRTEYKYNEKGLLAQEDKYSGSNATTKGSIASPVIDYSYDVNNNLILKTAKETGLNWLMEPGQYIETSKIVNEYDTRNNLIKSYGVIERDKNLQKVNIQLGGSTYQYDDQGRVSTSTIDSVIEKVINNYTYDKSNRIIKNNIRYASAGNEVRDWMMVTYEYK